MISDEAMLAGETRPPKGVSASRFVTHQESPRRRVVAGKDFLFDCKSSDQYLGGGIRTAGDDQTDWSSSEVSANGRTPRHDPPLN